VGGRLYRIDWYPGLVVDVDGDEIAGEVYAVAADQLAALDEFEGGEYRRVRGEVRTASGETMNPWIWEWREVVDGFKRIPVGDWLEVDGK